MSKKKVIAITGLAAALSILSPGCSQEDTAKSPDSAKQVQQVNHRRGNNWEDVSVSYISRDKDFIKSVNLLLSMHDVIIPEVQKSYAKVGGEKALADAFANCRMKGLLKDNSRAYTFTNIVLENYGPKGLDFETWAKKFRTAGEEAKALLKEPEGIHRKFVPSSFNDAFRRPRSIEKNNEWATCDELEKEYYNRQNVRVWDLHMKKDPRNW